MKDLSHISLFIPKEINVALTKNANDAGLTRQKFITNILAERFGVSLKEWYEQGTPVNRIPVQWATQTIQFQAPEVEAVILRKIPTMQKRNALILERLEAGLRFYVAHHELVKKPKGIYSVTYKSPGAQVWKSVGIKLNGEFLTFVDKIAASHNMHMRYMLCLAFTKGVQVQWMKSNGMKEV